MIENPDGTIEFLRTLRCVVGSRGVTSINFDHETCEHLDLCASILMDVLLMTARVHWRRTGQRVRVAGKIPPPTNPIHKLLVNSGVIAHLIGSEIPNELLEGVHKFKLINGGKTAPSRSARKEIVSSDLAAYFANCLQAVGFELKKSAQGLLTSMVSEVLDNSELHGNADGRWYAIGYFNRDACNAINSECHIVLFNFGDSLYQSLKRAETSDVLRTKMNDLSNSYPSNFLDFGHKFRQSTLWTLYALQDGVSRFASTSHEVARGSGTADMIKFFNDLSAGDQRMAIISGDAYILDDGRFPPGKDAQGNTVFACNADNDLSTPPDQRCVFALDEPFPGTLISLRFPFNKDHLERLSLESINASDSEGGFSPLVVQVNDYEKT